MDNVIITVIFINYILSPDYMQILKEIDRQLKTIKCSFPSPFAELRTNCTKDQEELFFTCQLFCAISPQDTY